LERLKVLNWGGDPKNTVFLVKFKVKNAELSYRVKGRRRELDW
jgi:hypothetical protein